jgi:hemoglobin
MELTITPFKPGERIEPFLPDNSIFEVLGEKGIRKMISDFYDLLIESEIKHLFHEDKKEFELSKQYAADFIIQRFGGPNYYNQRRGNPKLVKRHAPFEITPSARIVWLECYREALLKQPIPEKILNDYWRYLDEFSTWMVNSPEKKPDFGGFKPAI